jgi:chromosomal replication initiator protein
MLTPEQIIQIVGGFYKMKPYEVVSDSRKGDTIRAKHKAMFFIRRDTKLSLSQIGKLFEGRNGFLKHDTILKDIRSVQNQIDTDRNFRNEVYDISELLESYEPEEVFMENDYFN